MCGWLDTRTETNYQISNLRINICDDDDNLENSQTWPWTRFKFSILSLVTWRNWLQKSKTGQFPPLAALLPSFFRFTTFCCISQSRSLKIQKSKNACSKLTKNPKIQKCLLWTDLSGGAGISIPLAAARLAMKSGEREPSRWRCNSTFKFHLFLDRGYCPRQSRFHYRCNLFIVVLLVIVYQHLHHNHYYCHHDCRL